MTLGELYVMYASGALNVEVSEDGTSGTMGGVPITDEQAKMICSKLGWKEYVLSPFKIIDKTRKFISALSKTPLIKESEEGYLNKVEITFQNKHASTYGKTFDRIVIDFPKKSLTVIYNMENTGAKYVVYETRGNSIPISKNRNLKGVAEFISNTI